MHVSFSMQVSFLDFINFCYRSGHHFEMLTITGAIWHTNSNQGRDDCHCGLVGVLYARHGLCIQRITVKVTSIQCIANCRWSNYKSEGIHYDHRFRFVGVFQNQMCNHYEVHSNWSDPLHVPPDLFAGDQGVTLTALSVTSLLAHTVLFVVANLSYCESPWTNYCRVPVLYASAVAPCNTHKLRG